MTAILGYTDLLAEEMESQAVNSDAISRINTIRKNAKHLLAIINDILDMSKIEAGKMTVEQVKSSPVSIVSEVVDLMQHRAVGKSIGLNVEYLSKVPESITSDPTRLRQILLNLVGNAIKFTEVGTVRIQLEYRESSLHGGELLFRIIDSGIGMTEEQRERIASFTAFNQADYSTTRKFGGSGLGLRISNSLAHMLNGGIHIASEYGRGSTFTLLLRIDPRSISDMTDPRLQRERCSVGMTPEPASKNDVFDKELPASPLEGMRLLLAEDGPDNQRLISFVLRKAGAAVDVVENGMLAKARAIEMLSVGTPYDVVLMDMQMPIMDGYTATGELRRAGYDLPIIALTAHAMYDNRRKCLDAGCDDYAVKPIDRPALIELVAKRARNSTTAGLLV